MKVHEIYPYFDSVMDDVMANLHLTPCEPDSTEREVAADLLADFGDFPDGASYEEVLQAIAEALDEYYGPQEQEVGK